MHRKQSTLTAHIAAARREKAPSLRGSGWRDLKQEEADYKRSNRCTGLVALVQGVIRSIAINVTDKDGSLQS